MSVKLWIGADVVPTESSLSAFMAGDAKALLGEALLARFLSADARIFDLECPLYNGNTPGKKCGPALVSPEDAIAGIQALSPTLVTIANNHILDHGEKGLNRTMALLDGAGIQHVGAGENAAAAAEAKILDIAGVKVGVLAYAEREFSLAGEETAGANGFDPLEAPDQVRKLKAVSDYVIVLYHGGPEGYAYPTEGLQKRLRKLASCGADAVICQHGHCVGCAETYEKSVIVYGQGNFLFDVPDGEPCWDEGLLIGLTLEKGRAHAEYLPILRVPGGVRAAEGAEAERILAGFDARSAEILRPGAVRERTRERAMALSKIIGRALIGDNKLIRAMNAASGRNPLKNIYDETARLRLEDYLGCETLHELVLAALKGDA